MQSHIIDYMKRLNSSSIEQPTPIDIAGMNSFFAGSAIDVPSGFRSFTNNPLYTETYSVFGDTLFIVVREKGNESNSLQHSITKQSDGSFIGNLPIASGAVPLAIAQILYLSTWEEVEQYIGTPEIAASEPLS